METLKDLCKAGTDNSVIIRFCNENGLGYSTFGWNEVIGAQYHRWDDERRELIPEPGIVLPEGEITGDFMYFRCVNSADISALKKHFNSI